MKITHRPYFRTLEEQIYLDEMVEDLKKNRTIKPPSSEQALSTAKNLARPKSEDAAWQARLTGPLPEGWQAVPKAKTIDEAVGMGLRKLDPEEISHVESVRRRPKNSTGQSMKDGISPLKRDRAVAAITCSPPARVTPQEVQQRAVNLVEYKSEPLKEEWVDIKWYQAIIHWIKGNKVKQQEKPITPNWRDS